MKIFNEYFSRINKSLVNKMRFTNILAINVIVIVFLVSVIAIIATFRTRLIDIYTRYHITRVRHAIELEMSNEITYIKTLSKSAPVVNWFKNPEFETRAENLIMKNTDEYTSLTHDGLILTLVKEQKTLLFEPDNYYRGNTVLKELDFSIEELERDEYLLEKSYHDYILSINSNSLSGINNLWFTAGVYDDSEFLGTISFSMNFDKIANQLLDLDLDTIAIHLVDSNGYIKSSSSIDYRYLWKFENTNIIEEIDDTEFTNYFNKISDSNDLYINLNNPQVFKSDYNDGEIIATALPIGGTPWSVVSIASRQDLIESFVDESVLLYLLIIIVLLYMLLSISTEIIFKKPFSHLTKSLANFKTNKSAEIYGTSREDEIGFISNTFKELSTQLVENNMELERTVSKRTDELKNLNIELAGNQNRLKKLFNSLPLGIITFNGDGELVSCNDYALSLFEIETFEDLKYILANNPETIHFIENYNDVILSTRINAFEPVQRELRTKNAKFFWADIRILYVPSNLGGTTDLFDVFISNITKVKNNELELQKKAYYDELTGLRNRRYLDDYLADFFTNAENEGEKFTMIILDIDNFKKINDKFGHDIGDVTLKTLADILTNTVRNTEIVARWGGEEFVVLLPKCDERIGEALAERLRRKVATSDFVEVQNITITLGVAEKDPSESMDAWFKRADQALYLGKHSSKNVVKVSRLSNNS